MLKSIFQTAAEFIYGGLAQIGVQGADIDTIKLALQIAFAVIVIWLYIRRDKPQQQKDVKVTYGTGKKFKPTKWTPEGYYYDEEKKIWVEPDFKNTKPDTDTRLPK